MDVCISKPAEACTAFSRLVESPENPEQYLMTHRLHPVQYNSGLFKHDTHPINFTLIVCNIVINYVGKEHVNH